MAIATVNPTSGETLRTFEPLDDAGIDAALQRATAAFRVNRARSFRERSLRMGRTAELLDGRAGALGRVITTEMGKPLKASVAEVQKCALVCRYYAEHAERFLADEPVQTDADRACLRYRPIRP